MAPETGILYGNEGVDQILGKLVIGGLLPVGACHNQGIRKVACTVINSGGISHGNNAFHINVRGAVDNSHKHADAGAQCHQNRKQTEDKTGFKNGQ